MVKKKKKLKALDANALSRVSGGAPGQTPAMSVKKVKAVARRNADRSEIFRDAMAGARASVGGQVGAAKRYAAKEERAERDFRAQTRILDGDK